MITERDREIINFIYDIGFATIEQIGHLFFQGKKTAYDLARRRLKKIKENGSYIKSIQNKETTQVVYIPINSERKNVTVHSLKIIDYVCELKKLDCEIERIEVEPTFGNIRPDAYVVFAFNGYRYHQLVEVQLRHGYVDIERFENGLNDILDKTQNILPSIIIIQNTKKIYPTVNSIGMNVIQLRTDMGEVAKVLL